MKTAIALTDSLALEPQARYGLIETAPEAFIGARIRTIRGKRVLLDRDLAALYGVKAIRLREQVRRNRERFPELFMFQLNDRELSEAVSQSAIPSRSHAGGALPYAFTEHGVLMLANVLRSERAIAMSIRIIELFVRMREALSAQQGIVAQLEQLATRVDGHDVDIAAILRALRHLQEKPAAPRKPIGY